MQLKEAAVRCRNAGRPIEHEGDRTRCGAESRAVAVGLRTMCDHVAPLSLLTAIPQSVPTKNVRVSGMCEMHTHSARAGHFRLGGGIDPTGCFHEAPPSVLRQMPPSFTV
jgi:hypothetical protein